MVKSYVGGFQKIPKKSKRNSEEYLDGKKDKNKNKHKEKQREQNKYNWDEE